jgi:hypothetical protein
MGQTFLHVDPALVVEESIRKTDGGQIGLVAVTLPWDGQKRNEGHPANSSGFIVQ